MQCTRGLFFYRRNISVITLWYREGGKDLALQYKIHHLKTIRIMKKKLANLLFMVTVALQATAQITILSMDDVKKSEPIDELVFRACLLYTSPSPRD